MIKSRGREWFRDWFGRDYLTVYAHRDENAAKREIEWIVSSLALTHERTTLDLACGAGRHLEFLREYGVRVVGLDLSDTLLSEARQKSALKDVPLLQGDMRHLPFQSQSFALVLCLFTSFGYFSCAEEHLHALSEMGRVLTPNGTLVLDLPNFSYTEASLNPFTTRTVSNKTISERRSFDRSTMQLEKVVTIEDETGARIFRESVHLFTPDELAHMLSTVGLHVDQRFGDFDGSTMQHTSPRMISVIKKSI